jgi:AcrR family transcriptional regulator
MSHPTRRGRARAATEQDIRRTARKLLVEQGPEAVTLRAIARELGITAPALYRYYESRDDLVENLRLDVCADLADDLAEEIAELPLDEARQMNDVNWLGTIHTVHAGLPRMIERGRGHIVVVSSGGGVRGFPHAAVYNGTKAAQRGFAEALRHELGDLVLRRILGRSAAPR